MIWLLLIALLTIQAWLTRFDALGFPRTDEGGTEAEQRAFHRLLYLYQAAGFALFGTLCLVAGIVAGNPLAYWPLFAVALWWQANSVQDVGYWLWRLGLGLNTYAEWDPFGTRPYWKRWNLLYRVIAFIAGHSADNPLPKWVDTTTRLIALLSGVAFLLLSL